jgi:hypothetical protein
MRNVVLLSPYAPRDAGARMLRDVWDADVGRLLRESRYVVTDVSGRACRHQDVRDVLTLLRDEPAVVVFLGHGLAPGRPGHPGLLGWDPAEGPVIDAATAPLLAGKLVCAYACHSAGALAQVLEVAGVGGLVGFADEVFFEVREPDDQRVFRAVLGGLRDFLLGSAPFEEVTSGARRNLRDIAASGDPAHPTTDQLVAAAAWRTLSGLPRPGLDSLTADKYFG